MKYAKHMPANVSPPSTPKDQRAIRSSPSGLRAFFRAKTRQRTAKSTPMAVRVPNTMRSRLSGRRNSFLVQR